MLIRILGDFDLAEEAVQEAFVVALARWPRDGFPDNPGGWIARTARNTAIDRLRRERRYEQKLRELALLGSPEGEEDGDDMSPIPDDRLRLFFTCCHPALAPEARVALTLRTLGGLSTAEVEAQDRRRPHSLPGAGRPRPARAAALRARRAVSRVQRGLPGGGG